MCLAYLNSCAVRGKIIQTTGTLMPRSWGKALRFLISLWIRATLLIQPFRLQKRGLGGFEGTATHVPALHYLPLFPQPRKVQIVDNIFFN